MGWLDLMLREQITNAEIALVMFIIIVGTTRYQFNHKRFEDDNTYFRHRCLWWIIACLPILFVLISLYTDLSIHMFYDDYFDYADKRIYRMVSFWHRTAIWVLISSTVSLGPAIYQNRSEIAVDGMVLLLADCCGLVYLLLYFSQPNTSASTLFGAATAFTVIVFIATIAASSLNQVKLVAKTMLFIFSILLTLAVPLMLIKALYWLLKHGDLF
ncbi:hypothetical protein [Methyloglobulus sp.]|uniref:hypothetical protein n=1 Tax=Methyloglobulus sp. TaxID=2518622 RepID=UPI0032B84170